MCLTKRLRGIWHAWHFQFALSLVVTALCGSFCIACLHPLTRRYVFFQHQCIYWCWVTRKTRPALNHRSSRAAN
ncbi:TPA: DUF3265 domain-containing protein [Vibrio vulnificus]|nr:DUF3265 domain-containing protein [Vibrio vulnificus]HAS6088156.1 DUF3265 domain-containing protein [Vibrio vulnificus]HAS6163665.1 DUF3265 domain-containing protein [Vibrio vulnificus]